MSESASTLPVIERGWVDREEKDSLAIRKEDMKQSIHVRGSRVEDFHSSRDRATQDKKGDRHGSLLGTSAGESGCGRIPAKAFSNDKVHNLCEKNK